MVMLPAMMDRSFEEKAITSIEGSDHHEKESYSEHHRLSARCRESSSPFSSEGEAGGDDEGNSIPSSTTCSKQDIGESRSSGQSSPDQVEIAATLFASQGLAHGVSENHEFQKSISSQSLPELHSINENVRKTISSPLGESERIQKSGTVFPSIVPSYSLDELRRESYLLDDSLVREPSHAARGLTTKPPFVQPSTKSKATSTSLRRGKWTAEEEAYVARVIHDFNSGYLDAPAGTTLRTYLSEKLKCDPMRITKKFTGEACIGKRVFHPAVRNPTNASLIDKAQAELNGLERKWRRRLEQQQRESAKKNSASVVAASLTVPDPVEANPEVFPSADPALYVRRNPIAKTASWLDRAKNVLKEPCIETTTDEQTTELEIQIQEVQRLINEGPSIQQTSQELPQILDQVDDDRGVIAVGSGDDEPADKRLRTTEDAEALVGFLRSVRASAAQGDPTF